MNTVEHFEETEYLCENCRQEPEKHQLELCLYPSNENPSYPDDTVLGMIAREYIEQEFRKRPRDISVEYTPRPCGHTMCVRSVDARPELVDSINELLGTDGGKLSFQQIDHEDFVICFESSKLAFDIYCALSEQFDETELDEDSEANEPSQ